MKSFFDLVRRPYPRNHRSAQHLTLDRFTCIAFCCIIPRNIHRVPAPAAVAASSLWPSWFVSARRKNLQAFAALKNDGSVVTWEKPNTRGTIPGDTASRLTSGVVSIASAALAFAVLKSNDSVVAWGNEDYEGSTISPVDSADRLKSGVVGIYGRINHHQCWSLLYPDNAVPDFSRFQS